MVVYDEQGFEIKRFANNMSIAKSDPLNLVEFLTQVYTTELPEGIYTPSDMEIANGLLGKLSNEKTYLSSLLAYLKIAAKLEKQKGNKEEYDNMVCRRDAVDLILKAVQGQYDGLSRMVTTKIETNKELMMMGGIT